MLTSRTALVALVAGMASGAAAQGGVGQWTEASAEKPLAGVAGVRETAWTAPRPPGGPWDTIELHRYRGEGESFATLLYLPGTNMNGEVALTDERYNLWIYLARRGVDVFALDYRTHQVAEGVEDFRFMSVWTMRQFVEDAAAAGVLARDASGRDRFFVAGFSRGGSLAWLLASHMPEGVAGVIPLDSGLKSHAPKQELEFEPAHEAFAQKGEFASDVAGGFGWERRQQLMRSAAENPAAPAPEGDGTLGEMLGRVLYDAWTPIFGPGALANAPAGRSRPEVLAALLEGYDRYYPAIQNLEGRVLADYADAPYTGIDDAWGELEIPVLYFGTTRMGSRWILDGIYTAVESGSSDVTLHVLEDHGHLDLLVGEKAVENVFGPVLAWLKSHTPETAP
jgi:pimeloyl-ACP methyl ester carboxylesterase